MEVIDYFNGRFFESKEFAEALGIVWGFGSLNDTSLLLRHRDKGLIDRFCSLVKITGNIFPLTTQKEKLQWSVTVNISSLFVQRIMSMGYQNIAHIEARPMPSGEFHLPTFLHTYAQLHYTYDSRKCSDGPWIRHRIRFYGSTEILRALNDYLNQEFAVSRKTIQNHKSSNKMKMLYIQNNKEVPKVLEWLNA
ncbi:hypothetical protein [Paenibacillus lautus]|uniref:hypothetical protein n=1 Tax=Paenibacillus lautus TaxID=1401 RepID=UPI002DB749DB|nr:hypothetical protein [Paenibacillus lautus]MEC0259335.1 hypothetical protein [Paenibacillus lautus]